MTITIVGASGFVGRNLTSHLLTRDDCLIRLFCRSASELPFDHERIHKVAGDIFDGPALDRALKGADVAVYLVHMMGESGRDYYLDEAKAARTFAAAAKRQGIRRVLYLSGLGDDDTELSKHLASRHNSGEIMRGELPQVIEFRASMVIGRGSVAFDIIRAVALKLPVLAVPRWAVTPTQPITLADTLRYLAAGLELTADGHQVVEIGGPEVLTYPELVGRYARWRGNRHHVFTLPLVPRAAATWWLGRYLPDKDSDIGGAMIDSLRYPMIIRDGSAHETFPQITPRPIETAFF